MMKGAWCLVLGAWCLVLGAWCLVRIRDYLCISVARFSTIRLSHG